MAITTLAGVKAGMLPANRQIKNVTMAATAGTAGTNQWRGITDWYQSGATANAAGVNGQAVTYPYTGAINRVHPATGKAYLAEVDAKSAANNQVTIWLVDRLWENSGLSTTLTTSQSITPAALPARDVNASTNGEGVMAAIEWSAAAGAGTPACQLTYTNSAGTGSKTANMTGVASTAAGTWEIFDLAAGDYGIRSVQAYIANATRTSGTMHLVLFRVIAQFNVGLIHENNQMDFLSLGLPEIYSGTVLQTVRVGMTALSYLPNMNFRETIG
jgi:hypothetical protein